MSLRHRWRREAPGRSPLERQRERRRSSLAPATEVNVRLALMSPVNRDLLAASEAATRARYAEAQAARQRTERITYTIDLTRQQWALLAAHGYNPALPPNGMRGGPGTIGTDGRVGMPLRTGVCELEGVEIDGHVPSDLDPFGGCMFCGKEDIYGDRDEWDRMDLDDEGEGS